MPEKASPREIFQGLRSMALNTRPEMIGVEVELFEPYAVLMETGHPKGIATLVAVADGSASLYFSTGGGLLGGGAHESVSSAATALVAESALYLGEMAPATQFPGPALGEVVFYVLTLSATYTAVDEESSLELGQSPLTPLFFAGQRVITEYRLVSQSGNR